MASVEGVDSCCDSLSHCARCDGATAEEMFDVSVVRVEYFDSIVPSTGRLPIPEMLSS